MRSLPLAVAVSVMLGSVAYADPSVSIATPVHAGDTTKVTASFPGVEGPIRGVAAVGSVGAFRQTSPGTFEADLVIPPNSGPAQVGVAVFEDKPGGQVATGIVNVTDQTTAKVKVKTHEPVFVKAGAVRAGPFHPESGEVTLNFAASGDVKEAQIETAQGKALLIIPVKVKRANVVLFERPQRVRPGEPAPAEAVVVAPNAEHFDLSGVRVTASAGNMTSTPTMGPAGVARFSFTAPDKASGDIDITANDALGKPLATGQFALAGRRVDQITIKAPPHSLGIGDLAQLTISLRDAEGRPVDGDLTVETDVGTLIAPFGMAPGLYNSSFTAPTTIPPNGTAHIRARAVSSELDKPAVGTLEIQLHGGKSDHVVIAALPALHPGEKAEVKFQVLDKAGNPAQTDKLDLSVDKGAVADIHRAPDGTGYVATYTAPDEASAHITVEVHDGPLRLDGQQQFDVAAPTDQTPFVLFGPEVGFTSNLGAINTASIVGEVMFKLPYYLSAGLYAGYLPATTTTLTSTGANGVAGSASFSRIPIHPRVGGLYLAGPFEVHAGIEVGPTDISGQLTSEGRTASLSGWKLEYGAYVGGGYQIGPGYISGELRGTQAKVDVNQDNLVVNGSIGGVNISVGYLFSI